MRKSIWITALVLAIAAGGYAYYVYTKKETPPVVTTVKVTRGEIAETVGATGQLQAVTTVQVGTQVSGTVSQLNADFNTLVHKGQVIARLDPSLFQTQIEQGRANLIRAQADLERLRVSVDDARSKLKRAEDLAAAKLIPQADLETAQVAVRSADAQLRSQQAAVTQSEAALQQAQVNLDHTVISAPIDGLVISRNVDVGQTVAASMSAPTLFVLAADLTKMQVIASLDESDVGRIRPGQLVHFRVDAYPNQDFAGSVTQVRLQPQTVQNVVTYSTVIDVPNPDLLLKPGMTANVNIQIARKSDVLRIANAALRFRPTAEIFQALGQPVPAGGGRGGRGGNGGTNPFNDESLRNNDSSNRAVLPAAGAGSSPTASPTPPAATSGGSSARAGDQASRSPRRSSSAGQGDPPPANQSSPENSAARGSASAGGRGEGAGSDRRGNFRERYASMTPEEREQVMARMRTRGLDPEAMLAGRGGGAAPAATSAAGPAASGAAGNRSAARSGTPRTSQAPSTRPPGTATTIDALFGPLPPTESFGQAWTYQGGKLARVPLRLGITDGQQTEILRGSLHEDEDVVTNIAIASQRSTAPAGSTLPPGFQQPGRGFRGGGGGGGRGGR